MHTHADTQTDETE